MSIFDWLKRKKSKAQAKLDANQNAIDHTREVLANLVWKTGKAINAEVLDDGRIVKLYPMENYGE